MIRLYLRGVSIGCDTVDEAVAMVDRLAAPPLSPPIVGTVETRRPAKRTTKKPAKTRKAGTKAKTSPPPAKTVPKQAGGDTRTAREVAQQGAVFTALMDGKRPMRTAEIAAASELSPYQVGLALKALVKAKRIFQSGATSTRRYHLATAASAKPKPDAGLEPFWTGTKERKGEAPSLSSVNRA